MVWIEDGFEDETMIDQSRSVREIKAGDMIIRSPGRKGGGRQKQLT